MCLNKLLMKNSQCVICTVCKELAMLYLVDRCCSTLPQMVWEELGRDKLAQDT